MSNSSIIFAGYVPERRYAGPIMQLCSVLCNCNALGRLQPPTGRGTGLRQTVVAFQSRPHPEVVLEGKTGYLSPTGDVRAMAAAIRSLLTDDAAREKMGKDAANS